MLKLPTNHNLDALRAAVKAMDQARNHLYLVEASVLSNQELDTVMMAQTDLEMMAENFDKMIK